LANINRPNGFHAQPPYCSPHMYEVDADSATAVFKGNMMMLNADGYAANATAASAALLGSTDDFLAGSTAGEITIHDDPDQLYSAQDDGSGTPAQTDIGNNADHVATAGVTALRLSKHQIALSTAVNTTEGFTLLSLLEAPGRTIGDNAVWLVRVMEHLMRTGKTTV